MKVTTFENSSDKMLNKNIVELENNECILNQYFFNSLCYKIGPLYGELIIPEGIIEIKEGCFGSVLMIHTYHFPKTLKKIHRSLWNYTYMKDHIKVVYKGTSDEFIEIAKTEVKEVCESDGFDRYPYYSGGSRWVTHYYSFDVDVKHVEVYCEEDDTYLDYGYSFRKNDEIPKKRKI